MATKSTKPVVQSDDVTEDDVVLANHTIEVNGNTLHLDVKDSILMIRNAAQTGEVLLNTSDENLSRAFMTAWLALVDKRYPAMDMYVHLLHSPEELKILQVSDWAGYLMINEDVPYASKLIPAKRFVSIPTDPGCYQFEYLMGEYKVTRKMKNSRWVKGEPEWIRQQRNTLYKHLALNFLLAGRNINARYFPRTAIYTHKISEVIAIPDAEERHAVSQTNIDKSVIKNADYSLGIYEQKLAEAGKKFESKLRGVKLADGTFMPIEQMIGHVFSRKFNTIALDDLEVSEVNAEHFVSLAATRNLIVSVVQ